jgi:DNA-binding CsgD family transcriptional regulator
MLGESFFNLGRELSTAESFDQVTELLGVELCRQMGAAEIVLLDIDEYGRVVRVIGDGKMAGRMRELVEEVDGWIAACRKEGVSCEVEGVYQVPELKAWVAKEGGSDAAATCLIRGRFRAAALIAWKEEGGFDTAQLERFRAVALISKCVLGRIHTQRFDARVLEYLMHTRRGATNAVFIVREDKVAPYNPAAVGYAEACWGKDDVECLLSEEAARNLWSHLAKAYTSPVDPHWMTVEVDLGCGPVETGAIVRPDGRVVLMFAPPARQMAAPSGPVSMLTRRQCDIMDWIAEGKTSAEVAMILEISPRTVEKHLEAIFQRFGVENRVAAVRSYLEAKGGLPIS